MRALVHRGPTPTEDLRLRTVPTPHAPEGGVLVRVAAAAPNPVDWHLYRGMPRGIRLLTWRGDRLTHGIGEDFSGVVTEVAPGVTGLTVGQRVFGSLPATAQVPGAMAEFVPARAEWVVPLPVGVDPVEAATVSLVGLTALQALRDKGRLHEGARVLVWGASGGVGHLGVQIAKLLGASRVDAVCSGSSADMVRRLGADRIIDYTRNEVPTGPYDVILDTVCTAEPSLIGKLLAPGGTVVTTGALGGGPTFGMMAPLTLRAVASPFRGFRARTVLTDVNAEDLGLLASWMREGTLRSVVSELFPLDDAIGAYRRLEQGRVHGKLAVLVDQSLVDGMRATTEA